MNRSATSAILVIIASLFYYDLSAQTCTGNYDLNNQFEIEAFASLGCVNIVGNLKIGGEQVTDISALHTIKSVTGYVWIAVTLLDDLDGLQNLESVDSFFLIYYNRTLTNIDALQNLKTVEGRMAVGANQNLDNIDGLARLRSAKNLEVNGNFSLKRVRLDSLENLIYGIEIWENEILADIHGFNKIKKLSELRIYSNHGYGTIEGFNNLDSIQNLFIKDNNDFQSISGFQSLRFIKNSLYLNNNDSLSYIEGFDELNTVGEIDISDHALLAQIPSFNNVTQAGRFTFRNNLSTDSITGFANLNLSDRVFISKNPVLESIQMPSHVRTFESVYIGDNPLLSDLQLGLQIDSIGELKMHDNPSLVHISPFASLESIGQLQIDSSAFVDLHFLPNLKNIDESIQVFNNPYLEKLFINPSVKKLNGVVTLNDNDVLQDLTSLDSLTNSTIQHIDIRNNPTLKACNTKWICEAINEGATVLFEDNDYGCLSEYDVRKGCDAIYSHIHAGVFYDANQNGIQEASEPLFPTSRIRIFPNDLTILSQQSAPVTHFIEFGNYEVTSEVLDPANWMLTTSPDTFTVLLSESHDVDTIRFGYFPSNAIDSMSVFLNSSQNLCNFPVTMRSVVVNDGTVVTGGTLWIKLDSNINNILYPVIPDVVLSDRAGFRFNNVFPGEHRVFELRYSVPGPEEFETGSPLHFASWVEYDSGEITEAYSYSPIVLCSFDPNDKLVYPSRIHDQTLLDEELHYTIRFQNTGNYHATDIFIKDTLNPQLDASTIKVISSSHLSHLTTFIEDAEVTFSFDNIYLPDSTSNPEGSQGYVDFLIRPKQPVLENTIIENTASIYFDLNPPIRTNTTRNRFVNELNTSDVRAWYADGQVWVIWKIELPIPETVGVYADNSFFTNTADATLIGRPFHLDYLPVAIKEQVDTALTFRIPDGNGGYYQLQRNEGLFVFTPHQEGAKYFAVVPWGETSVDEDAITTEAIAFAYDPVNDPVECHLQTNFFSPFHSGYRCQAYYMWVDGRDNYWESRPDFPVMGNAAKNGMPGFFMISAKANLDTTQLMPLSVWLHGGGGTARQSLAGSRRDVNIDPEEGILLAHNDDVFGRRGTTPVVLENPSLHFGYRKDWDPFSVDNLPTERDTIINYTQRRYLWIDQWMMRKFNIDPNRVHIHGHSMGSWGTTGLIKAYPEHYASAVIFNNGFRGHDPGSNTAAIFGEPFEHFYTNLKDRNGNAVTYPEIFDLNTNASGHRDIPILRSFHSKNDVGNANYWGVEVVDNYRQADAAGHGIALYWSERGHGIDTGPDWNDHWINGNEVDQQTATDDVRWSESLYRADQSYPAFFNHRMDPSAAEPGDGTPGTGAGSVGDDWGTWGGYHRWDPSAIVDEEDIWSAEVWLESEAPFVNDNFSGEKLQADIAVRRPMQFKPLTGSTIYWRAEDVLSGQELQSGTRFVEDDDLVIIPGVEAYPEATRKVRVTITTMPVSTSDPGMASNQLTIHPNPVTDELNIIYHGDKVTQGVWKIISVDGRITQTGTISLNRGEQRISLPVSESINPGIYLIRIEDQDSVLNGIFMKE